MRFNGNLDVDIAKWTQVKMERENNMREYKGIEEEQPKYVGYFGNFELLKQLCLILKIWCWFGVW